MFCTDQDQTKTKSGRETQSIVDKARVKEEMKGEIISCKLPRESLDNGYFLYE